MKKSRAQKPAAPCEAKRCKPVARCTCNDYNALLALALWDLGRALKRAKATT